MEKLPHAHGDSEKIILELEKAGDFNALAESFKLLSDGTRLKLFWLLCHTRECVINLSKIMGVSSPCLSHHLKILKTLGLVEARREGKEMIYSVSNGEKATALHQAVEILAEISCPTK